jgi:hypothetical protein
MCPGDLPGRLSHRVACTSRRGNRSSPAFSIHQTIWVLLMQFTLLAPMPPYNLLDLELSPAAVTRRTS